MLLDFVKLDKKSIHIGNFIKFCEKQSTSEIDIEKAEKFGYETSLTATHPFKTDFKLKIFIANFILMDYGTGAIFACPAHDQRDLDFARKYDLPVIDTFLSLENGSAVVDQAFVPPKSEKVKWLNHFTGLDIATGQEAIDKTIDFCPPLSMPSIVL